MALGPHQARGFVVSIGALGDGDARVSPSSESGFGTSTSPGGGGTPRHSASIRSDSSNSVFVVEGMQRPREPGNLASSLPELEELDELVGRLGRKSRRSARHHQPRPINVGRHREPERASPAVQCGAQVDHNTDCFDDAAASSADSISTSRSRRVANVGRSIARPSTSRMRSLRRPTPSFRWPPASPALAHRRGGRSRRTRRPARCLRMSGDWTSSTARIGLSGCHSRLPYRYAPRSAAFHALRSNPRSRSSATYRYAAARWRLARRRASAAPPRCCTGNASAWDPVVVAGIDGRTCWSSYCRYGSNAVRSSTQPSRSLLRPGPTPVRRTIRSSGCSRTRMTDKASFSAESVASPASTDVRAPWRSRAKTLSSRAPAPRDASRRRAGAIETLAPNSTPFCCNHLPNSVSKAAMVHVFVVRIGLQPYVGRLSTFAVGTRYPRHLLQREDPVGLACAACDQLDVVGALGKDAALPAQRAIPPRQPIRERLRRDRRSERERPCRQSSSPLRLAGSTSSSSCRAPARRRAATHWRPLTKQRDVATSREFAKERHERLDRRNVEVAPVDGRKVPGRGCDDACRPRRKGPRAAHFQAPAVLPP